MHCCSFEIITTYVCVCALLCVGVAASSGLGATTLLAQLLKSGDHIIAMDDCYGGKY